MLHLITFLLCLNAVRASDNTTLALKFLNHYHYITQTWNGNHNVTSAIEHFQRYFHLSVSGSLDEATVGLMKKPRCGVPDDDDEVSVRRKRFVTVGKWNKNHLTYFIDYGLDLGSALQDQIFKKALAFWADVSRLSFSQVSTPGEADIKISFGAYTHAGTQAEDTCPYPFDGVRNALAHAFYPSDGRAHFDESETFTHESQDGINLLWVATHEFGHSLGLEHTNVEGAVMYPYYTGYVPNFGLHSDDIAGIQSLYGAYGSCNDIYHDCMPYKNAGYCNLYRESMKYWCGKTCSLC